jgi:hypothetical protein
VPGVLRRAVAAPAVPSPAGRAIVITSRIVTEGSNVKKQGENQTLSVLSLKEMLGQFVGRSKDKDTRAGGSRRESALTRNRASIKSILKHENKRKAKNSTVGVRFKDQCRTSRPYLAFFSKESR